MGYRSVSPGYLWVVRISEHLSRSTRDLVKNWPYLERSGIGDQLQRAVDSIGLNISEGYARSHLKEQIHFFTIAKGSLEEALFALRLTRDRGLIPRREAYILSGLLMRLDVALRKFSDSMRI